MSRSESTQPLNRGETQTHELDGEFFLHASKAEQLDNKVRATLTQFTAKCLIAPVPARAELDLDE